MRDTYFLDREGNPLGGKIPLQVYAHGGGDAEAVRAEANGLLNAFLENVRQSIAPNHKRTFDLPGGGSMTITSLWGHVKVDLFVPPTEDDGGPFYGGILINPHVITGDQGAYLSLAGNPTPWRVPDAVKTAGAAPGRPAVPGTGSDSTEWLVVQIARDLPLTGDPLASGAVRMYRIADPKFGGFCEVAEPGRYAVSTIDGSAFFLCGQQLDHVPPMPSGLPSLGRSVEAGGGISPSRIRTVGMQPASFTAAHAAEGIIIFALVNQLWALHTRERTESTPAPWRLLAEASMPRPYPADYLPNEFGAVFTVSAGASTTITCSGTNGVGECSGWTVTITPGSPLPTLSGTITLVDSGFRASAPHEQTIDFTGSYSRPSPDITVDSWDMSLPSIDVADVTGRHHTHAGLSAIRYVAYKALGLRETHVLSVSVHGPTPAIVPDTLLGGWLPRRSVPYQRAFYEFGQTLCEYVAMPYRLKGMLRDNVVKTLTNSGPVETTMPDRHVGQAFLDYWQHVSYSPDPSGIVSSPASGDTMWLSPLEFVDFYFNAYSEWTVLESNDPNIPLSFRIGVAGEYNPLGTPGLPWTERVMGVLYVNTKEINDRVFQWVQINSLTPINSLTYHLERREGPQFSQPRYRDERDFNNRLAFPGLNPFPKTEPLVFYTPTDLPAHNPDPPYPSIGINYNPGTTDEELQHWFPFWSQYDDTVDSGGVVISGGVVANFEGELICRYPKRAAVFDVYEHYEVTDEYTGSLLGRSFTTEKTRQGGQLVANEFMAHLLPSNIDTFIPGEEPEVEVTDDREAVAGATYERDPFLRYAYTARDWHCHTMGWRRDAGRAGSWFIVDIPLKRFANNYERALLRETADRVECSLTLYRAGGESVLTFSDLMASYPLRHLHSSLSLTTKIVNIGCPYLQHDLLYLDRRFPELDDCDSIGIPQTGGLGTTYNLDEGDTFFFDTECLPRREWMPDGPYRDGWTPNRPQLVVGYWGRDAAGGARDPLFPVPGYWIPNPEEDPPEGEEYVHVPHITEATETNYNLSRPERGFSPDFSDGIFLASPRNSEFYELQARNFLNDIGTSYDVLYVDNRTGGFITQVLWSGNGGRISEAYIGNRTGVVPFRPIFDAWLALGGGAAAEGTKIAIDRPPTSIGGPAPGAINPQQVSLL